jgi:hypothetical protein
MKIRLEKERYDMAQIGEHPIRVLPGTISINRNEFQEMRRFIEKVWERLGSFGKDYTGFARLDLFMYPKREEPLVNSHLDYGNCAEFKVIELNSDSPECASTTSLIRRSCPYIFNATQKLAEAVKESFGKNITFVVGEGYLKKLTVSSFIKDLSSILNLEICSEEDILKGQFSNKVIWAWGDIKPQNAEFTEEFIEKLKEFQQQGIDVFNSINPNLSSKATLYKNGVVNGYSLRGNLERVCFKKVILKPLFGSGGKGILFSDKLNFKELESLRNKEYGVFEYYEPPKILIPGFGRVTFDWNPALWIERGEIKKILYIVVRMNPLKTFSGTHNVSGGGSYGGIVEIEK